MNFKRIFSLLLTGVVLLIWASSSNADSFDNLVLVELFTSEGCSSCPPADDILQKLSRRKNVITISEHVDYWNNLGWVDPYSSNSFSKRQLGYVRNLGLSGLATPQFIIDGHLHISGSSRHGVNGLVSKAAESNPKIPLKVSSSSDNASGRIIANVSSSEELKKGLFLHVVLAEENLSSRVTAGENRGSFLRHVSVARAIKGKRLSTRLKEQVSFSISKSWNLKNIKVIAFIQETPGNKVIAIGSTKLL